MKAEEVIKELTQIFIKNWQVWMLGFMSVLLSSLVPIWRIFASENLLFMWVGAAISLILFILYVIATAGLVFVVNAEIEDTPTTLHAAASAGKSKFLRIMGLAILFVPILLAATYLARIGNEIVTNQYLLRIIKEVSESILVALFYFAFCAIIIHHINSFSAFWTSLLITTNNLGFILILLAMIFVLEIGYWCFVIGISLFRSVLINFPSMVGINNQTILEIIQIPVVDYVHNIFSNIVLIWTWVTLIVAYKEFTQNIKYPALEEKEEATYR